MQLSFDAQYLQAIVLFFTHIVKDCGSPILYSMLSNI